MSKLPLIIVASATLLFSVLPTAHASTFTFTGACTQPAPPAPPNPSNCVGSGTGTLVATLGPGGELLNEVIGGTNIGTFVSFTYTSSLLSLSFTGIGTGAGQLAAIGAVLTSLPGHDFVEMQSQGIGVFFSTTDTGATWCAGTGPGGVQ